MILRIPGSFSQILRATQSPRPAPKNKAPIKINSSANCSRERCLVVDVYVSVYLFHKTLILFNRKDYFILFFSNNIHIIHTSKIYVYQHFVLKSTTCFCLRSQSRIFPLEFSFLKSLMFTNVVMVYLHALQDGVSTFFRLLMVFSLSRISPLMRSILLLWSP